MSTPLPVLRSSPPTATAPFERVAIVGLGLIGASIAMAYRQRCPTALLIAVDHNDVLERAMRAHVVDVAGDDLTMVRDADLVVLCAPVSTTITQMEEVASLVRPDAVVTDVGSTKRAVVAAAASWFPGDEAFVGGHPFAGAARSGFEHASVELFRGRPWFLTPAPAARDVAAVSRLAHFVTLLGAEPMVIEPDEHDRLMAPLSHVPQVVASCLMKAVGSAVGEAALRLAGRGLRDTTRLSSSAGAMWSDIAATNHDAIAPVLDAVIAELAAIRDDPTGAAIRRVFGDAQAWRAALDRTRPL